MKLKIFSLLLVMIMVVGVFASCDLFGKDNGEEDVPYAGTEYNVNWKKTELIYELNEHSQSGELESGTRRYYAGDSQGKVDKIDSAIDTRNDEALKQAHVTVKFTYVGTNQEKENAWSANVNRIFEQTSTYGPGSVDIYCNFAYDMTCAAIKGSFANLKGTYGEGNFFEFNKSDYVGTGENYFDAEAGEGYFYDYMKSLSLSDDKMFVLGSNYCTDLVRSFVVIPVQIDFLNEIEQNKLPAQQYLTAGATNIQHFYNMVWDNAWTYSVLADYAAQVYNNTNQNHYSTELADANIGDKLGFAVGNTSGLTGSGILYTTSVKIINKTPNGDGTYTYSYPSSNSDLTALSEALYTLFDGGKNKGITVLSAADAKTFNGSTTDLIAIRSEFKQGNILFGGIIAVGSLENEDYQALREGGNGFGIAPVPLYKAYEEGTNEYQTLVHNLARIVGIAGQTTKFAQCSAYLDYVSRNSQDILDEYYEGQLASSVGGVASTDNSKMLTYIRNHVRDCFDKTYEDVIGNFNKGTDSTADQNKWHEIIARNKFVLGSGISTEYQSLYSDKMADLNTVLDEWKDL